MRRLPALIWGVDEMRQRILVLSVALALAGETGLVLAQTADGAQQRLSAAQSRATIGGRVISEAGGNALPGATIRLQELGRETVSGRDGSFLFTNVPPGSYSLRVSYEGLDPQNLTLSVAAGDAERRDIRLRSALFSLEEIVVKGRLGGFAETINMQRNAASVRTVVSADALGQIREGNIGDALVRLPGVSVETRAGVQRTATIRGLAPQYNSVTVNGLRMTNVDGNRDIALDSFPFNLLSIVEVVKAPTPDMPADAIGGTVNLITRSAFDRDGRTLDVEVGTTYNDNRSSWNRQGIFTLGDTFGESKQFGLLASVAYFQDNRGYDVVDTAYTVGGDDSYFINRALYYDRDEKKDKIGAGLVFDFRPTDATSIRLNGIYHYDYRDLWRRGTDYRPNPATRSNVTPDSADAPNSRVDTLAFYREPKNVFQMYSAHIEHRTGDWILDSTVAYSKARKTYPETLQVINSFTGVDLSYDRSRRDFPAFQVTNDVDITDPSQLRFTSFTTSQVPRVEDEWTFDANAERDFFDFKYPVTMKTGVRVTQKDASQGQPDTVRFSGINVPVQSLLETYRNDDFMSKSDGRAVLSPFFPDWRQYRDLQLNNPGAFSQNPAAVLFTEQAGANSDFDISEDIYAGYVMADVDINGLQIMAGVRVEHTKNSSEANQVVVRGGQVAEVNRIDASNSYTNILPGIHLRYAMMDDKLILRSSLNKAISRPPPGDLIASRQENEQLNQRIIGNPNLKPAESDNLDITAEYFLPPLGVLSAGVFYKSIDNFVFSTSRLAPDGVDERTRTNGDGGRLRGLELVWAQQLSFLPGALSGLGVEANYTRLETRGSYPGRSGADLPFVNSPKYIFNGILSYVSGPMDVRLSYNRLPSRLESVGGREALDRYNAASEVWDFAVRYAFMDRFSAFLNVKNLFDEPVVQFQGSRDNPTTVVYFGRQFNFGLRYEL